MTENRLDTFYTDEQGKTVRKISLPPIFKTTDLIPIYGFWKLFYDKRYESTIDSRTKRGEFDKVVEDVVGMHETNKTTEDRKIAPMIAASAITYTRALGVMTYNSLVLGGLGALAIMGLERLLK